MDYNKLEVFEKALKKIDKISEEKSKEKQKIVEEAKASSNLFKETIDKSKEFLERIKKDGEKRVEKRKATDKVLQK